MKKRLLVTRFLAIAVSTPVYALFPFINRVGNPYSFVAHWGVPVDPSKPSHPLLVGGCEQTQVGGPRPCHSSP
jgi:hypothetical protein